MRFNIDFIINSISFIFGYFPNELPPMKRDLSHVCTAITKIICAFAKIGQSPIFYIIKPGRVAQSVAHLTRKSGVLGSIPGLATYFRFSFRFFQKGSSQLLAKVCARSTG